MLQTSLHLCMAVQFDEYCDLVSACVSNIEVSELKVLVYLCSVFVIFTRMNGEVNVVPAMSVSIPAHHLSNLLSTI